MAQLTPRSPPSPFPGGCSPPLPVLLTLLVVTWQAALGARSSCTGVRDEAGACFTDYSREFHNMQTPGSKRLCCGVDVETLRAFCSSYMKAMQCIEGLKERCPGDKNRIQEAMRNLKGAETALDSLCANDRIFEVYARHQNCITRAAPTTETCFRRHLNTSDSVRLLTNFDSRPLSDFCRDMRGTLQCIQKNVNNQCGEEASVLASKLVKPMIRQSTKCDYNVVTQPPISRQGHGQPSPSSQDGRHSQGGSGSGSGSGSTTVSSASLLVWLAVVIRTLLFSS
ncbi:uncharacterized protein [Littorina saxatilis]|uniref:uncharacterized protein n=1 Tax=Littorina saxatilis TaxID=31220 RepID=UPI0038B69CEE